MIFRRLYHFFFKKADAPAERPVDPPLPRAVVADTPANRTNPHWCQLIGKAGVILAKEPPLDDGTPAVTWRMDGDELPHEGVNLFRLKPEVSG